MAGGLSGFTIGVTGLRNSSRAIEVVSSNISNANVVGFKTANFLFVEEYFRSLTGQGGNEGLAVSGSGVRRVFGQGSMRTTTSPLDLSINGSGFFRLSSATGQEKGDVYYTRNGQFSVDKDGYILNATGLYFTGFQPNIRQTGVTNDIGALKVPASETPPSQTGVAKLYVNLDARSAMKTNPGETTPKPFNPDDDTTFAHATAFTVYDNAGNKSTARVYYQRVADADKTFKDEIGTDITRQTEEYKMYMSVTNVDGDTQWVRDTTGTGDLETTDAPADGVYDTNYQAKTLNFFDGKNIDAIYRDPRTGASINSTKLDFSVVTGTGVGINKQPIEIDLTDTTRYSSDFTVTDLSQDGYGVGSLNSITFDENGRLYGVYSNGKSILAGQAVLASFKSPDGLAAQAQNLFSQTATSGEALLGAAGSGGSGVIRSSALEEANIDMASELVSLMIQQRNYQANAESIKAQDQLLQTTINLSR